MATYKRTAEHARQLYAAAQYLHGNALSLATKSNAPEHEAYGSLLGAVILQAFSLELLLKALQAKHKVPAMRSHDLGKLFDSLPTDIRHSASDTYAKRIAGSNSFVMASDTLASLLKSHSKVFEHTRYLNEYSTGGASLVHISAGFHSLNGCLL